MSLLLDLASSECLFLFTAVQSVHLAGSAFPRDVSFREPFLALIGKKNRFETSEHNFRFGSSISFYAIRSTTFEFIHV
jgi:hypothetical protein